MVSGPLHISSLTVLLLKEELAGQLYDYRKIRTTVTALALAFAWAQAKVLIRFYFDKLQLGGYIESAQVLSDKVNSVYEATPTPT